MATDLYKDLQESELCGGDAETTITTLRYEFDGFAIIVEGVPAIYCSETGEELVAGPLAVALGDVVHKLAETARIIAAQRSPGEDEPFETTVRFPVSRQTLIAT